MQVDTSHILFICGGAFADLDRIIRQRTEKSTVGFGADIQSKDTRTTAAELVKLVEPEDLIKFGLIPEFVGRLPVISVLDELDETALINILTEPKNALVKQYQYLFKLEGVDIEFRRDALTEIARQAIKRKSGARGLRSIMENTLLNVMYELPDIEGLKKVVVDEHVIKGEAKPLYMYESQLDNSQDKAVSE